jgi:hypothetical protein
MHDQYQRNINKIQEQGTVPIKKYFYYKVTSTTWLDGDAERRGDGGQSWRGHPKQTLQITIDEMYFLPYKYLFSCSTKNYNKKFSNKFL